jgi:hypothetical protein
MSDVCTSPLNKKGRDLSSNRLVPFPGKRKVSNDLKAASLPL